MEREKVMAERTSKVSAIRSDETEVSFVACWVIYVRSSMIQPSPASPVDEFHAASVKIEGSGLLGFGSILIKGIDGFGFDGGLGHQPFSGVGDGFLDCFLRGKASLFEDQEVP